MKIHPRNMVILLVAGIILIGLVVIVLFANNRGRQRQPEPVYSHSGVRVILPSINYSKDDMKKYLCVKLVIQDVDTGAILFDLQTSASDRMRWSVKWIDEKSIQLSSSDIGNYCWAEGSDGTWHDWECPP
jgi:hypothetical protein